MQPFTTERDVRQPLLGRPAQWLLLLGFALLLTLPTVDWVWGIDPAPPPQENRVLAAEAQRPADIDALIRWPTAFEAWYRDHFGLRNSLIAWHSTVMLDVLGVSPNKDVLLGPKGWLDLGSAKNVDAYRCLAPFTQADLQTQYKEMQRRRDWLKARGIAYVNLWVPIKSNIYPENLPSGLQKLDQPCRLNQLADFMQQHRDVAWMDCGEALRKAKAADSQVQQRGQAERGQAQGFVNTAKPLLYYHTDTHWNAYGAWVGYQAFAPLIRKQAPKMQVLAQDRVQFVLAQELGGDLARLMDLQHRYRNVEPQLRISGPVAQRAAAAVTRPKGIKLEAYDCPTCGTGRAVMTHDSFGNALIPYLAQSFGHFVAAEFAGFDEALFEAEKPDVVIELHLERQLTPDR